MSRELDTQGEDDFADEDQTSVIESLIPLVRHRWLVVGGTLLVAVAAAGGSFLIAPSFTSRTVFLPPQQAQSAAASALSSLGALGSIAGAAAGIRSPADQYVALLQSTTVADRLIDQFELLKVYNEEYRFKARKELAKNTRITLGKKDGLITLEVDDEDPKRAADMANQHVAELRKLTERLALTEAQQRRVFFEAQLKQAKGRLDDAQRTLQESGFNQDALKAEPKATAEAYAKLKAELTNAEVRLQAMRQNLADSAPEVRLAASGVSTLRAQLAKLEQATDLSREPGYIGKYREFKYQETLFELFSRQYELARVDESREGPLIQVVDVAQPAERKSRPKRAVLTLLAAAGALVVLSAYVLARDKWRRRQDDPQHRDTMQRLASAWRGKA